MGNTESKLLDVGLRTVCALTGGMLGKSDDGYHIGPLRIKENSFGIVLNTGFINAKLIFDKSESGDWQPTAGLGVKIPGAAELKVEAKKTNEGFNVSPSVSVNVGPLKIAGGFTIDQDSKVTREYISPGFGPLELDLENTLTSDGHEESKVTVDVTVGVLKSTTTINPRDNLDYNNIRKNTKFGINYDYFAKKSKEEEKNENKRKEEEEMKHERIIKWKKKNEDLRRERKHIHQTKEKKKNEDVTKFREERKYKHETKEMKKNEEVTKFREERKRNHKTKEKMKNEDVTKFREERKYKHDKTMGNDETLIKGRGGICRGQNIHQQTETDILRNNKSMRKTKTSDQKYDNKRTDINYDDVKDLMLPALLVFAMLSYMK